MRRSVWGACVAVAAIWWAAPSAAGATAVLDARRGQEFRTRDANVRCRYAPAAHGRRANMRCDVIRTDRGARVAGWFTATGRARVYRPRDAVPRIAPRVVRNNNTVAVGPFRCTLSDRVMVCMSIRSPYGFAVGASAQAALAAAA
ncbi:MAG: hypothetical protein IT200_06585 [Thermoleophilia bacterium]|nr:hypothetical protein [Thermoleophilia bacterium]